MSTKQLNAKAASASASANTPQKKYLIDVVVKNFYASTFKRNARMLQIVKATDKDKFHILDAVMIDKNKVKIFSSITLTINNARYTASKCAKEERPHYYTCTLDDFLHTLSKKYALTDADVALYRAQLEACYNA